MDDLPISPEDQIILDQFRTKGTREEIEANEGLRIMGKLSGTSPFKNYRKVEKELLSGGF